jgi:hypothetical protein
MRNQGLMLQFVFLPFKAKLHEKTSHQRPRTYTS